MKHVVSLSGGVGSWETAKRVAAKHGTADLYLLFADTRIEDESLYKFLVQGAANVGGKLICLAEGRDPWQVFFDVRFLGNSRVDPCSKILKRDVINAWIQENCDPEDTTVYVGIDWTEEHRFGPIRDRYAALGWRYEAPLCEPPYMTKKEMFVRAELEGLEIPRLYDLDFAHNNCGGFCVKAGQAHFANLLAKLPERYAYHEGKEQDIRRQLGKDVAILRDRRGGKSRPMTLQEFRMRVQAGGDYDKFEVGGCGCFTPVEDGAPDQD